MGCHRSHFSPWLHFLTGVLGGGQVCCSGRVLPSGKDTAERRRLCHLHSNGLCRLELLVSSFFLFLARTQCLNCCAASPLLHVELSNRAPWSQFGYSRVAYTFTSLMNMVIHSFQASHGGYVLLVLLLPFFVNDRCL